MILPLIPPSPLFKSEHAGGVNRLYDAYCLTTGWAWPLSCNKGKGKECWPEARGTQSQSGAFCCPEPDCARADEYFHLAKEMKRKKADREEEGEGMNRKKKKTKKKKKKRKNKY